MYDRADRFKKIYSSTPKGVGPATYYFTDDLGKKAYFSETHTSSISSTLKTVSGVGVPFNSTQFRDTSFTNKSLVENPSPNKYKIRFRKIRIVGGTSIQNKAPRLKYRDVNVTRGPYPESEPKKILGKVCCGVPPRNRAYVVSSVPEKGTVGYEITSEGPVKIYYPPEDRPIGPTTYYNPEGQDNLTSLAYRGSFWSLRTEQRFRYKEDEGPGPAAYHTNNKTISPLQKYQYSVQSENSAKAPLLRSNDILQRKLCRENLPGPASYLPFDPNTHKCECGKQGTFTQAKRQDLYAKSDGPGPAEYVDPRTALDKVGTNVSIKQSPFNVDAERFKKVTTCSPGPGDYSPRTSMWDEIKQRGHSKFAQRSAPFDSSGQRTTIMTKRDSGCIPGPDWYYPEFQKKGDRNKSSVFTSKSDRNSLVKCQNTPGPAEYSVTEPFKTLTEPKSHLKNTTAAFLSSSSRLGLLTESASPAATTYNLPESQLGTKGCTIGERHSERCEEPTPGPPDYTVHPKFTKSAVFDTFNVTLGPPKKRVSNKNNHNLIKKLRCFSAQKYVTGHCPSSYYVL